jgi:predicted CXXCH cytochrome family protein
VTFKEERVKRNHLALVVLLVLAVATTAVGQNLKSKVINSIHDVGGNGCKSCHAPHNGSAANGGSSQAAGKILLWDRNFSGTTFGTYDSPSIQNKAEEIGGLPMANTEARMSSLLCMSCHDGATTTAVISATNPAAIGNPTNSAGLQNDHPVNMSFDPTKDTSLAPVSSVTSAGLALFGAGNTVQCGTCHNVHDPSITPFLRVTNDGSKMCTTCHL